MMDLQLNIFIYFQSLLNLNVRVVNSFKKLNKRKVLQCVGMKEGFISIYVFPSQAQAKIQPPVDHYSI